jgi:acyl-CoA hydrolase
MSCYRRTSVSITVAFHSAERSHRPLTDVEAVRVNVKVAGRPQPAPEVLVAAASHCIKDRT